MAGLDPPPIIWLFLSFDFRASNVWRMSGICIHARWETPEFELILKMLCIVKQNLFENFMVRCFSEVGEQRDGRWMFQKKLFPSFSSWFHLQGLCYFENVWECFEDNENTKRECFENKENSKQPLPRAVTDPENAHEPLVSPETRSKVFARR